MNYDVLLLRYGELSLKSPYVRKYFETTLVRNIKNAFLQENIPVVVRTERGRIYLITPEITKGMNILRHIFGIVSVSPAFQTTSNIQDISLKAQDLMKNVLHNGRSFAIRATRVGTHSFTSQDVAVQIGNDIRNNTQAKVDLTNPDYELFIEIRDKKSFLFTEKIKGVGGLPLSTQGTILAIITTPATLLAAWYLMHRGCNIVYVNEQPSNKETIRTFLASWYTDAEILFLDETQKEFYHRVSDIVSEKKCDAIVTGHTFENPAETIAKLIKLKANCVVPILTPLLSMTQKEIENHCKQRGIPL
jgi:thiamine biosynthesis protein ThiI